MGTYASVEDMRSEGVTPEMATDSRLCQVLQDASALVDSITGWFFEPRTLQVFLSGGGHPSIETPVPPLRVQRLRIGGAESSTDDLMLIGSPAKPGFFAPKLVLPHDVFPKGIDNICVDGLWGYLEPTGDAPLGRTPREIRRATVLCAMRLFPAQADITAANDARNRWRLVEERTRDQSYRLGGR